MHNAAYLLHLRERCAQNKLSLVQALEIAMKMYRGTGGIAPHVLNIGTIRR
jgi:hypothetical protein